MIYEDFEEKGKKLFADIEKSEKFEKNYMKIPVTAFNFTEENVIYFNKLASWLYASDFNKIVRTKSNGISVTKENFDPPCFDIRGRALGVEITIVSSLYGCMRIQWRNSPEDLFDEEGKRLKITGKQAFIKFKKICKKFNIDLDDYKENDPNQAIANKLQIEKAKVCFYSNEVEKKFLEGNNGKPITAKKMFHIDFHSSYMTGLVRTHPEFKEVVNYIYSKRKEKNAYYKAVLNMTQGYMQSDLCGLKWAHLSKDMISDNNKRIDRVTNQLLAHNFLPVLFNTDGIWYFSPSGEPYHGEGEGEGIGCWENDHLNCTFRAKSKGCYEYLEEGKYHAVVRGLTVYDIIKPDRDTWEWGDIFRAESDVIQFRFEKGYLWMNKELKGVETYEEIEC